MNAHLGQVNAVFTNPQSYVSLDIINTGATATFTVFAYSDVFTGDLGSVVLSNLAAGNEGTVSLTFSGMKSILVLSDQPTNSKAFAIDTVNYTPVPLPPSALLLGSGLLGLVGLRRFRKV